MTTPDSTPEPLSTEVQALLLKALIGEAGKALAPIEKQLKGSYPFAGTRHFESPLDGSSLGHINRAKTTPEWVVTSLPQLTEHFATNFPAAMETVYLMEVPDRMEPVVLPEDHPITQALLEAAPELLAPERRVPADTVTAALEESKANAEAAAPGIQLIRKGAGALSVVYDKDEGPAAIQRMQRKGLFSWSQLALPGAEPAAVEAAS